jgi:hypothetical protein
LSGMCFREKGQIQHAWVRSQQFADVFRQLT